ncbi:hypothetical protein BD289DRAFT_420837 [Coniella lustricola]|uniref:Secreted protein n=1 Tax=Coniella lustricola TaxID=2025994 RepID=A0A2T3AML2_9PEZI|nr:hypothetical protein BD289DRAFT_420837 [Coniella lustricola]
MMRAFCILVVFVTHIQGRTSPTFWRPLGHLMDSVCISSRISSISEVRYTRQASHFWQVFVVSSCIPTRCSPSLRLIRT